MKNKDPIASGDKMKKTKDNIDKRSKERIPLSEKVNIVCESMEKFITEYADNISLGGMFIKTKNPLPTGTQFNIDLTIGKEGKKITGIGEVVWTKEFSSDGDRRPSGMGIRFIELHGESKKFIKEFIHNYS